MRVRGRERGKRRTVRINVTLTRLSQLDDPTLGSVLERATRVGRVPRVHRHTQRWFFGFLFESWLCVPRFTIPGVESGTLPPGKTWLSLVFPERCRYDGRKSGGGGRRPELCLRGVAPYTVGREPVSTGVLSLRPWELREFMETETVQRWTPNRRSGNIGVESLSLLVRHVSSPHVSKGEETCVHVHIRVCVGDFNGSSFSTSVYEIQSLRVRTDV